MKKIDLYVSRKAPHVYGPAAWLKPVDGGFTLSILDNGWHPLKVVNESESVDTEAIKQELKEYIDEQIEAITTAP